MRAIVVGAIIVDDLLRPTRLLAARRSSPAELRGRWEFPGGKVEPGESVEDALHRELHEELSVQVLLGREVPGPDADGWPISARSVLRLWLAVPIDGLSVISPGPCHDAVRWLTPEIWDDVPWLPADAPVLSRLFGWFSRDVQ